MYYIAYDRIRTLMLQRYGNLLVYPNFIYIYFKIHVELHLKSEFLEINEHKV